MTMREEGPDLGDLKKPDSLYLICREGRPLKNLGTVIMLINVSLYRDWRGRAGGRRGVREPDPL